MCVCASLCFSFFLSSDFPQAIADFSRAIDLLPHNADFFHNRGFCYRKQGNFKAAIADYTRALATNPRHFKAVYNRAFSYDKVRRYGRAHTLRCRDRGAVTCCCGGVTTFVWL